MSYALYDEGAFRNDLKGWDSANMKIAPESLRTVNSALSDDSQITKVELGKYYGEIDKRTARVIFNEELLHPFQPYDRMCTANQIKFFENVFEWDSDINSLDQVWKWKEFFTLISFICYFLLIVHFSLLLLQYSFFFLFLKDGFQEN